MRDTQHNNAMPCAYCRYAECRVLFTIMLSVVMLSVVAPLKISICDFRPRQIQNGTIRD
jgi:hypothetical protein